MSVTGLQHNGPHGAGTVRHAGSFTKVGMMLQILVGVIVGYDAAAGRARIRLRGPIKRGELVRIVGGRTNKELRLDVPGVGTGASEEVDAVMTGVEPGDMVLRVTTVTLARIPVAA